MSLFTLNFVLATFLSGFIETGADNYSKAQQEAFHWVF